MMDHNLQHVNPYDIYRQEHIDFYQLKDEVDKPYGYVEMNGEVKKYS